MKFRHLVNNGSHCEIGEVVEGMEAAKAVEATGHRRDGQVSLHRYIDHGLSRM